MENFIRVASELSSASKDAGSAEDQFKFLKWTSTVLLAGLCLHPHDSQAQLIREKVGKYLDSAETLRQAMGKAPVSLSSPSDDEQGLQLSLLSVVVKRPNVKWSQVAGLERAKEELRLSVIMPRKQPQLFDPIAPWSNILLYGPPGTGKTFLAQALATESQTAFFSISSSDLISKYQGESERLVKKLFDMARERRPTVMFIDEIDSLCSSRSDNESDSSRRVKTELLKQMQGLGSDNNQLCVIGATNTPWILDDAFRRRFERRIYIPLPETAARKTLIDSVSTELTTEQIDLLAAETDGYSAADVSVLVQTARKEPIRQCQQSTHFIQVDGDFYQPAGIDVGTEMSWLEVPEGKLKPLPVTFAHYQQALRTSKSTVNAEQLTRYTNWTHEFGQTGI